MARLLALLLCLCILPALAAAQGIVINEVVYDDAGTDDDNWVELKGPPGFSLDGYRVVGINGTGGVEYQPILLTGFSIPADGYFLIAQSGVAQPNADLVTADVNYEDSPDAIQVQFEGEVTVWSIVDAVGYGTFGANDVFGGEGSPAPDQDGNQNPGASLARCPDGQDTDDNSVDFILDPNATPGAPNQGACSVLGACCFEDGRCEVLTLEECDQVGGFFQGEGTTCEPDNPCPQLPPQAACCFEDGSCILFTEEDCTNAGGNWLGGDTTCEPDNPCPPPPRTAACCVNGECVVATEADCMGAGGVWFPDQPNCDPPFECPPVANERSSWGQIKANYR